MFLPPGLASGTGQTVAGAGKGVDDTVKGVGDGVGGTVSGAGKNLGNTVGGKPGKTIGGKLVPSSSSRRFKPVYTEAGC